MEMINLEGETVINSVQPRQERNLGDNVVRIIGEQTTRKVLVQFLK